MVESIGIEMNDVVLQVLLILAFLAIGLISVTFPIYAISVNFLPRQKWEDEKERKKRMGDLQAKITELTEKLGSGCAEAEMIKEQLDKYTAEKQGTELRYQYLTAKGAVMVPILFLLLALTFAAFGIYGFYKDLRDWTIGLGIGSSVFSTVALFRLYKTISAVEYGALRPERTLDFKVGFGMNSDKMIRVKLGERKMGSIYVATPESDVENLYLHMVFPAKLGVEEAPTGFSPICATKHETCTVANMTTDYLPKGRSTGLSFPMTPKKRGKYVVRVRVCARGIYEYDENLTVEVV